MRLEEQINEGIKAAMKAQDKLRLETLRNIKKYFIEARTAGANMEELPDADALKIIRKLAKQGADSAAIYKEQGRGDLHDHEMVQVAVLKEFLPAQMSDAELTEAVRTIIAGVGAGGMQDMGRVMGAASKELAGKAEGKAISDKVRELLG